MDVVASLTDKRVMTGAVKWGNLGFDVHAKHLRELAVLAEAGHRWARAALQPEAPLLYVTGGRWRQTSGNASARTATLSSRLPWQTSTMG